MRVERYPILTPERRAVLKRAQGNAYQGVRLAHSIGLRFSGLPEALGHARDCQFIAGDPVVDAATCGKRSRLRSSYCAKHHAVCYGPSVDPKRSEAGRRGWETRQRRVLSLRA